MERSIPMKKRLIFTAMTLLLTMPAIADFKLITQGYEVMLNEVRLPHGDSGTIAFKPCNECDYVTRRIDSDVRWEVNGRAVTLSQFRKRADRVRNRDNQSVTVTRHVESDRITMVSIVIPETETVRENRQGQNRG
jgi:hypothetical protein